MFKFIFGPIFGVEFEVSVWLTALLTGTGMMLSVVLISYLGEGIREILLSKLKKRKRYRVFTKRKRKIVRIWQRFGMSGVAFLTPALLTPIGGTLIALSFGVKKSKIILYMTLSAIFWSPIISFFIEEIKVFMEFLFVH
jgi:hypothetical protein